MISKIPKQLHPHWDCVTFKTKNATLTHTMTKIRLIKNINGENISRHLCSCERAKLGILQTHIKSLDLQVKVWGQSSTRNNSTCVHMNQPQINNLPMQVHSAEAQ